MALQILSPLDKAYQITTYFTGKVILGPRTGQQHNALDYATPQGTPIYAVTDGVISRADAKDSYGGNIIQLDNKSTGLTAIYAHLSKMLVSPGQTVRAGQIIGYTGGAVGAAGSGSATTGPHLYFETRINGTPVDPLSIINPLINPKSLGTTASATLASFSNQDVVSWLQKITANANGQTWSQFFGAGGAGEYVWNHSGNPVGLTPEDMTAAIQSLGIGNQPVSSADFGKIAAQLLSQGAGTGPLSGVQDAIASVGSFLGLLADPKHWANILAIIGGAGLIVWGGIMVYNAA